MIYKNKYIEHSCVCIYIINIYVLKTAQIIQNTYVRNVQLNTLINNSN